MAIRRWLLLLLLFAGLAPANPSRAVEPDGLYEAVAVVSGTDEVRRQLGFRICLTQVLVEVSGNPALLDDPRVDELAERAGDFVAGFTYLDLYAGRPVHDEQGTHDRPHYLTTRFDPERIEAALAELGESVWRGARSPLQVKLAVDALQDSFILATIGDEPRAADMRISLGAAASQVSLTAELPADNTGGDLSLIRAIGDGAIAEVPAAMPGAPVLYGHLQWDPTIGTWRIGWSMVTDGGRWHWRAERLSFDDAFRLGMRGALARLAGKAR